MHFAENLTKINAKNIEPFRIYCVKNYANQETSKWREKRVNKNISTIIYTMSNLSKKINRFCLFSGFYIRINQLGRYSST